MRGFLWSQGGLARGKAKVAWDVVCLPKEEGGLGIRRLALFNVALISSHIWSIISLKESLWVKWIHVYKLKGRNFWDMPIKGYMTWSWRKILQIRPLVRSVFWYKTGNGNSISAWFDNWCVHSPLIGKFSTRQIASAGFRLDAKVSDLIVDGEWKWPQMWNDQLPNLSVPVLVDDRPDKLVCKDWLGKEGSFSVAGMWNVIRPRSWVVGWHYIVWFAHSIPRHAFLLWLVFMKKLKTQDVMRSWDISGSDQSMILCPLCGAQPDSHEHLFFDCVFSSQVWSRVKGMGGLTHVSSSWDSIVSGITPIAKKKSMYGIAGKLVLAASVYFVWQERNLRLFQQKRRSAEQLVSVILANVRMKLLSFKFKETRRWEDFRAAWNLPFSILTDRKT